MLFRDDRLIAIDKPSGLVVHRGWAGDRVTLLDLAHRIAGRRVHPVHRLDRGTSGVLVFALDAEAARRLGAAFGGGGGDDPDRVAGEVVKVYLALVRGRAPESTVVDHPIPRTANGPRVPARTEVRRLAVADLGTHRVYSLVEARPATGRLHQVRRHLKHLSLPVIGDVEHGKGEHNRFFRSEYGLRRLALHALSLELPHPGTGERLRLTARVPDDLSGPLAAIGIVPTELT